MDRLKQLALAAAIAASLSTMTAVGAAEPVNINTASAEVLARTIDGVGAARAADIVIYREQHGPFQSVDDLVLVRGIGKSIVERSRDTLSVTATN